MMNYYKTLAKRTENKAKRAAVATAPQDPGADTLANDDTIVQQVWKRVAGKLKGIDLAAFATKIERDYKEAMAKKHSDFTPPWLYIMSDKQIKQ